MSWDPGLLGVCRDYLVRRCDPLWLPPTTGACSGHSRAWNAAGEGADSCPSSPSDLTTPIFLLSVWLSCTAQLNDWPNPTTSSDFLVWNVPGFPTPRETSASHPRACRPCNIWPLQLLLLGSFHFSFTSEAPSRTSLPPSLLDEPLYRWVSTPCVTSTRVLFAQKYSG